MIQCDDISVYFHSICHVKVFLCLKKFLSFPWHEFKVKTGLEHKFRSKNRDGKLMRVAFQPRYIDSIAPINFFVVIGDGYFLSSRKTHVGFQ